MRGTVKWFDPAGGYGFITGEDGKDIFVHQSAITTPGVHALHQGQAVEYDIVAGPHASDPPRDTEMQAANVRPPELAS